MSGHPAAAVRPGGNWLNSPRRDELGYRRLGYPDVTPDPDEPDAPLTDQPPGKTVRRAEHLSGLGDGEQPVSRLTHK
jgi:hypothetical protein